MKNTLSHVVIY